MKVVIALVVAGLLGMLGLGALGVGAIAVVSALVGDQSDSSSWCAPAVESSAPAAVGEILAAGERTAAGMNASILAVFAASVNNGLDTSTTTQVTTSSVTKKTASVWIDKLVKLLRAGGAGSAYESPQAVQAAVLALGAPGDGGRLFSRWKQADLAAALAAPATHIAALTLVNAVSGTAAGPVASASPQTLARSQSAWGKTGAWLSSMLAKRTAAAAAGRSVMVIGDDVVSAVADDLGDVGYAVAARQTWTPGDISAVLAQPRAQSAAAWVIGLFTNKSARVGQVDSVVAAVHAAAGGRQVFWVTPFRNSAIDQDEEPVQVGPDGLPIAKDEAVKAAEAHARSSQAIAEQLRAAATPRGGMVLDWTSLAEANPAWFTGNDARPGTTGEDAYVMLITAAAGTTGVADAVIGNCEDDAPTLTTIDASQAIVLSGPSGRFTDGPVIGTGTGGGALKTIAAQTARQAEQAATALSRAQITALAATGGGTAAQAALLTANSTYASALAADTRARTAAGGLQQPRWVQLALARAQRALVEPPCDDNPGDTRLGCDGMCAQLAARIFGQQNGFYRPGAKRWAYSMWLALAGGASPDVARIGSGREFNPPVGAMLFWYMGPDHPGHVAVYVGGGAIVTNYHDQRVVQMPAQRLVDEYRGYVGWAVPPGSWQR